jgi:hypothetical protein
MANTYGILDGSNSSQSVTRTGAKWVRSRLQTYDGSLDTIVHADGSFTVELNGQEIAVGNVDRNEAYLGKATTHYNAAGAGGEFNPTADFLDSVMDAVQEYERLTGVHYG